MEHKYNTDDLLIDKFCEGVATLRDARDLGAYSDVARLAALLAQHAAEIHQWALAQLTTRELQTARFVERELARRAMQAEIEVLLRDETDPAIKREMTREWEHWRKTEGAASVV